MHSGKPSAVAPVKGQWSKSWCVSDASLTFTAPPGASSSTGRATLKTAGSFLGNGR